VVFCQRGWSGFLRIEKLFRQTIYWEVSWLHALGPGCIGDHDVASVAWGYYIFLNKVIIKDILAAALICIWVYSSSAHIFQPPPWLCFEAGHRTWIRCRCKEPGEDAQQLALQYLALQYLGLQPNNIHAPSSVQQKCHNAIRSILQPHNTSAAIIQPLFHQAIFHSSLPMSHHLNIILHHAIQTPGPRSSLQGPHNIQLIDHC
jgi:hypothetical protein